MNIKITSFLIFFLIWTGFSGIEFDTVGLVSSIVAPMIASYFANKLSLLPQKSSFHSLKIMKYILYLTKEIIKSSIFVSKLAWAKNIRIFPLIRLINSQQTTKIGLVVYANSITLTPGTLTLNTKGNQLLVHFLSARFIKDLENSNIDTKILESIN